MTSIIKCAVTAANSETISGVRKQLRPSCAVCPFCHSSRTVRLHYSIYCTTRGRPKQREHSRCFCHSSRTVRLHYLPHKSILSLFADSSPTLFTAQVHSVTLRGQFDYIIYRTSPFCHSSRTVRLHYLPHKSILSLFADSSTTLFTA